jgi:hypothetical protein
MCVQEEMCEMKPSEKNQTLLRGGETDISTNTDVDYTYTQTVYRLMCFKRYSPVRLIYEMCPL